MEKRQHESKKPTAFAKKASKQTKHVQPLEKRFLKVAKTGMWQPLEKGLAEVFKLSRNSLKKDTVFLLGRQPPQKDGAFGKKAVAPLECRPAERSLVHITRWSSKKRAWVGKGM